MKNLTRTNKIALVLVTAVVIILLGMSIMPTPGASVAFDEVTYSVDVSDDLAERRMGLSGRPGLDDGRGMLFIFEEPDLYSFWMKDMLFSIDIIWIDNEFNVVHIEERVSPNTYPEQTFSPTVDSLYVLEVAAGEVEERGIQLGDALAINL